MSGPQLILRPTHRVLPEDRSSLAHLIHALNQPLTGLQCSLELAVAGPKRADRYLSTLYAGLELTRRMRVLVEAIRELSEAQQPELEEAELLQFDTVLQNAVNDLLPVAETMGVHLELVSNAVLPLRANRHYLAALMFRFLESALSLTRQGTDFQIEAKAEREQVCVVVSWNEGPPPEHSPFSRPELGLLIAQSKLERAGAEWTRTRMANRQVCKIRLPLASADSANWEI